MFLSPISLPQISVLCVCYVISRFSSVWIFATLWTGLQPTRLPCPWDSHARILERVAMPASRGFFWLMDRTHVSYFSCIGGQVLYHQLRVGRSLVGHSFTVYSSVCYNFWGVCFCLTFILLVFQEGVKISVFVALWLALIFKFLSISLRQKM